MFKKALIHREHCETTSEVAQGANFGDRSVDLIIGLRVGELLFGRVAVFGALRVMVWRVVRTGGAFAMRAAGATNICVFPLLDLHTVAFAYVGLFGGNLHGAAGHQANRVQLQRAAGRCSLDGCTRGCPPLPLEVLCAYLALSTRQAPRRHVWNPSRRC